MIDPQDNKTRSLLDELPPQGFRGVSPPMVGWYLARRVVFVTEPESWKSRRWWNGADWSIPCPVGCEDEDADYARRTPSVQRPDAIEWMGLAEPMLRYPFMLEAQNDDEAYDCSLKDLDDQATALQLLYGNVDAEVWPQPDVQAFFDSLGARKTTTRRKAISFD